jgi:chemotaxis protein CheX
MTSADPFVVPLPAVLDLNAAAPLAAELLALRGRSVRLDASHTERLGGLCLQVLVSARNAWAADAARFEIADRSAAFDEALTLFGAHALFEPEAPGVEGPAR